MSKMTMDFQRQMDELRSKKPLPSRQEQKGVKRQTKTDVIKVVRARVFELDRACICGGCRPSPQDEMHEVVPRSALRGRPPEEIFNVRNCVRLSRKCHAQVTGELKHGKSLVITFEDAALGASGPVRLAWAGGRAVVYTRSNKS